MMRLVYIVTVVSLFCMDACIFAQGEGLPSFLEIFNDPKHYTVEHVASDKQLREIIYQKANSKSLPEDQYLFILQVIRTAFEQTNSKLDETLALLDENIALGESYVKELVIRRNRLKAEIDHITLLIDQLSLKKASAYPIQ